MSEKEKTKSKEQQEDKNKKKQVDEKNTNKSTEQLLSQVKDQEEKIKKLVIKLEEAQKNKDDEHLKYLRSLAEMDNLRKRHDKEKSEIRLYALEDIFKEMLPVMDSMDKAINDESITKEQMSSPLGKGFHLVMKQLNSLLDKQGLKVISSKGQKFNPNQHQAVLREESSKVTEATVKEDLIKGYMLHDRVIRPSMVSVILPKEEENSEKK